jgi:hypothetical protein
MREKKGEQERNKEQRSHGPGDGPSDTATWSKSTKREEGRVSETDGRGNGELLALEKSLRQLKH